MARPPTGSGGRPSALLNIVGIDVIRAIRPYLATNAGNTAPISAGSRILAVPAIGRPSGLPPRVHGAISMRESRRIRFTLPAVGLVQTTNSPEISTTQTGVGTPVPSRRKVVNSTYDDLARI